MMMEPEYEPSKLHIINSGLADAGDWDLSGLNCAL
jgi:hypothetical protein